MGYMGFYLLAFDCEMNDYKCNGDGGIGYWLLPAIGYPGRPHWLVANSFANTRENVSAILMLRKISF